MLIKVCGMRDPENLRRLEALDVDLAGFIFYPKSPRYVSPEGGIPETGKKKAGVFVDEQPETLLGIAARYRLDYVQLHGNESPRTCEALRTAGYSVIKVFPVATEADLRRTADYPSCADYFLFDTKCVGYGGSGRRFDWSLLDEYRGNTPFLLGGGLTPDCADDIKRLNHPMFSGIDLNSGFETSPAMKDIVKLNGFVREIRRPAAPGKK
ncbi:MAG: phosphoribosylanthranilate isomerase [Tannerella sp.]|jgi:phosphoribosylanthranilate isomerase|nr:phosphoribosylanthranilate isomerase [Tannerella sp.]